MDMQPPTRVVAALWADKSRSHDHGPHDGEPQLDLPASVVFEHDFPKALVFTDAAGTFHRRAGKEIDTRAVVEAMCHAGTRLTPQAVSLQSNATVPHDHSSAPRPETPEAPEAGGAPVVSSSLNRQADLSDDRAIVAVYVGAVAPDDDRPRKGPAPVSYDTQYFTRRGLEHFLAANNQRSRVHPDIAAAHGAADTSVLLRRPRVTVRDVRPVAKKSGLLQRFVNPPGVNNQVVQAVWTRHLFMCEKRTTKANLFDLSRPAFDRAATFDAPDIVTNATFVSPTVSHAVRARVDSVLRTVARVVGEGRKQVAEMTLYFKQDAHGRLWLLWCPHLRLAPVAPDPGLPAATAKAQLHDVVRSTSSGHEGGLLAVTPGPLSLVSFTAADKQRDFMLREGRSAAAVKAQYGLGAKRRDRDPPPKRATQPATALVPDYVPRPASRDMDLRHTTRGASRQAQLSVVPATAHSVAEAKASAPVSMPRRPRTAASLLQGSIGRLSRHTVRPGSVLHTMRQQHDEMRARMEATYSPSASPAATDLVGSPEHRAPVEPLSPELSSPGVLRRRLSSQPEMPWLRQHDSRPLVGAASMPSSEFRSASRPVRRRESRIAEAEARASVALAAQRRAEAEQRAASEAAQMSALSQCSSDGGHPALSALSSPAMSVRRSAGRPPRSNSVSPAGVPLGETVSFAEPAAFRLAPERPATPDPVPTGSAEADLALELATVTPESFGLAASTTPEAAATITALGTSLRRAVRHVTAVRDAGQMHFTVEESAVGAHGELHVAPGSKSCDPRATALVPFVFSMAPCRIPCGRVFDALLHFYKDVCGLPSVPVTKATAVERKALGPNSDEDLVQHRDLADAIAVPDGVLNPPWVAESVDVAMAELPCFLLESREQLLKVASLRCTLFDDLLPRAHDAELEGFIAMVEGGGLRSES